MEKIDKCQLIGLPPHAQLQYMACVPRLYFQYAYTIDGKKYTERDYLGKVDTLTLEFIPNAYFMREKPVFENRPIHHYKNEKKRISEIERRNKELLARKSDILKNEEIKAKAALAQEFKAYEFKAEETITRQVVPNEQEERATNEIKLEARVPNGLKAKTAEYKKLKEEQADKSKGRLIPVASKAVNFEEPTDVLKPDESRKAGASAVVMAVLLQTGMLGDLYYALDCNIEDTIKLVNLAIYAAISFRPTYCNHQVSFSNLFIGGKCLSSLCASEFYQRIGADQSSNKKISRA